MVLYNQAQSRGRRRTLSGGLDDQIAAAITQSMTGGPKGSPERADRTEFFSDILAKTGEKFVVTPDGQAAVNKAAFGIALPAVLVALALGYWYGSKKKRAT